jgi:hypothetical protein
LRLKIHDDHGSAFVMPAWTAGIQTRTDASGNIHVNLGSGTPCRNDETKNVRQVDQIERGEQPNAEKPSVILRPTTNMWF